MTSARTLVLSCFAVALLAGCTGGKPAHYYVLCDGKDHNGWQLIGTEYDGDYLIACAYQSQDKQSAYTVRCRADGCD